MNKDFQELILADKLSKLNSSQAAIETLSHWCIFNRSNAEQVVSTWKIQFDKSDIERQIPLLYLANDIMQNSKRNGNEFVIEFWKVLSAAVKDVLAKNNDKGNRTVARLLEVWGERNVFGSHVQNLKDIMLGEGSPPPLELGKKRSRSVKVMKRDSVKILKRDSRSIKSKLSIGGTTEKIVSAFHLVLSEQANEDEDMSNCKSAVQRVRKIEKDVDIACTTASAKDPKRKTLMKDLEEQQNLLKRCIEKLKLVEASRAALVYQLKEALLEQESELESVRTQMQVAQAQIEEASNMQKRLDNEDPSQDASFKRTSSTDAASQSEAATKKSAAAIAAEVADKLTASSSSQLIMRSVLSTFAAEEAKSARLTSESTSNSMISMPSSDAHVFMPAQQLNAVPNHSYPSVLVTQPTMHNAAPSMQGQYHLYSNPSPQQYVQSTGGVISPYGYGSVPPLQPAPPPPPFTNHTMQTTQQQPVPTFTNHTMQTTQQQPVPTFTNHTMHTTQQQPGPAYRNHTMQITQQHPVPIHVPVPPSFRPLQPSGTMYYVNH
ncbi:uncharacterized protein LOC131661434 [Vicia villosa]|uniref:uncharacterized protein LOC131661434 n=1 Tax=Vicia villosa TaxID=3911 RepID=UPI00273C89B4|nr:uncharacterized protein LOC131661434 [Vicia villosa]